MITTTPKASRPAAAIRRHYEIERELADRLREATPTQRRGLYRLVYNELFERVVDHPQKVRKLDPRRQHGMTVGQLRFLGRFLRPGDVYLEVGAGDCHLAMEVARRVRHAYAVDVSDLISAGDGRPSNFNLVLSDGVTIPVPTGAVDVAYSNQLMEHLHPDDASEQLKEIFRVLAPGGQYVCVTPHRFSGPQDVSAHFDVEATGFHLKEYTYRELRRLFRSVGFSSTQTWVAVKGRYFPVPQPLVLMAESVLAWLPRALRKWVCDFLLRSAFSQVRLAGSKKV